MGDTRGIRVAIRSHQRWNDQTRARGIRVAGIVIILLGAGAALLPTEKGVSSDMIGAMLIAAGLVEVVAGSLRGEVRQLAMAAGAVTALAGLLFVVNPETKFFPSVTPVIAWLLIRSVILAIAATRTSGSVRTWMALSAGMDFLLAAVLVAGLSIATIVVTLFGPTAPLIATFAWVLAASFVVNGLLQLEVASCERAQAAS
jgi:uncharacterized membrane protein HdeD (DUF308 family)